MGVGDHNGSPHQMDLPTITNYAFYIYDFEFISHFAFRIYNL